MADHPCLTELLKSFDGKITKSQGNNWLGQVNDLFLEGKTSEELIAAATRLGEEKIRTAEVKKRNTALMLQAEVRVFDYIKTTWDDDILEGIFAVMGGSSRAKQGGRLSAYAVQRQYETKWRNGLVYDLDKAELRDAYISGDMDKDIAAELHILNDGERAKPTGNAEAVQIAKIINKHMDDARNTVNKYGGDIRKLKGYVAEQTHDQYKIRKVSEEQWAADTYSRLDIGKTFKDIPKKYHTKIMSHLYKTFSTGEQFKIPTSDPVLTKFQQTFNVGEQASKSRYLHFKSPDDWLDYNGQYGYGSLVETINNQLLSHGDAAGIMQVLGPNPREVMDRVRQRIGFESGVTTATKITDNAKNIDNLMAVLDGTTRIPGNPNLAQWGMVARGMQSLSKLGASVISAGSDIPISASELRYQGQGFLSRYNHAIVGGYNSIPKKFRKELALKLGIYNDGMTYDMTARASGREDIRGSMSRAQGLFFKLNLLQPWTDRMRTNMGLAMAGRLGHIADKPFAAIEPELKRVLGLYNIGEQDWKVLSKAVEEQDGYKFMTPTAVEALPDSVISPAARTDLANRFRVYYTDRAEIAVVNPDARTNALLTQGTQVGTVEGEFMRSVTQFKSFPTAVMQKVIARDVYGEGHRTFAEAMRSGSAMAGLAETIVMTTAFGYMSMTAKDMLKGRAPRDPLDPKTMTAAMLQGGALGLYGDFLLGTESRFGRSPVVELMGPTAGTAEDIVKTMMKIRDGDDPTANAISLVKGNTPFVNLFYTRMALDYLIFYRMQEYINPGYLGRMERRVEEENRQEWFMKPSDRIPYGGF